MADTRVYIGTSGWSYPSGYGKWSGVFYPKGFSGDELAYYAERFPAVEVNASFYRLPSVPTVRSWVERTPAGFRFTVKLFQKFTHPAFFARTTGQSPAITEGDIRGMRGVLDALAEHGRLGALLVQYPEHFFRTEANTALLTTTLETFRDYPLAVELRNTSWQHTGVTALLGSYRATFARIDEPGFSNLSSEATADDALSYWRFHGRNTEGWRSRDGGAKRYDYLYTPDEVDELANLIASRLRPDRPMYLFFNNHPGGQAAANAVSLSARLKQPLPFGKFAHLTQPFPFLRDITGEPGGQMRML